MSSSLSFLFYSFSVSCVLSMGECPVLIGVLHWLRRDFFTCSWTLCMHDKDREESSYINVNAVGLECSLERSKPRTALLLDIPSTHYKEERSTNLTHDDQLYSSWLVLLLVISNSTVCPLSPNDVIRVISVWIWELTFLQKGCVTSKGQWSLKDMGIY